ncbi:hypothetical protein [Nitrosopumilus piranensis]|uniref:Uncharacterized protein n=1 Tax=Nitrosopumilus piranensis TaxID=1582439 RepID=A0A0C5BTN8_9ARCH|nr:hypothetical protein [Nitrosopumilus piranensis]AJM93098.1 membrane protein of unknown function [Nitrosopumilus piranensis]
MKTRLLIIIAVFLVLIPWIRGLDFGINNEVMMDGLTVSSVVVMTLTVVFSLTSWILFSWASKNIRVAGIPLSIITATSLILPFSQTLGPMSAITVGVVAGFASFMIQKKMIFQTSNKSLIISVITMILAYSALLIILAILTGTLASPHVWDTGDGIGAWTGTAEGMEETTFGSTVNVHIEFVFFLVIIPSLIITILIIQGKIMKSKFLIISGIALMVQGLFVTLYLSLFLLPPVDPPVMRPIEGINFVFVMYRHAFLFGGIMGFFITLVGVVTFWRNRK